MKIVFVGFFRGIGGAQKQLVIIANAMAKKHHDVTLISIGKYHRCFDVDEHVKVINLCNSNKKASLIKKYRSLLKTFKKIKPDLTVSFWLQPIYLAVLCGKKNTGKLIYSERCDPTDKQYKGLLGLVRRIAFSKVDAFVFQTSAAKKCFDKTIQDKSIIIPNPVYTNKRPTADNGKNKYNIVSVGRLHRQKNFPLLIESFDSVKDKIRDYRLIIFGDGEEKDNLNSIIKEKGLKDRVVLAGKSDNVGEDIDGSALFVLSSDYEGMPNALLEAMSLGIPCISTNWSPGGVYDIIENKENGIIVERGDKKGLGKAIVDIINDESLMCKLSQNAKKTIKKYKPETIYNEWDGFLKRTVRRQSK